MVGEILYRVIRSRRKTAVIQITPQGEVLVRCPMRMPVAEIERFVYGKAPWIRGHLSRLEPHTCFLPEEIEAMRIQAAAMLPERVAYFATLVGVTYGKITVRCQRTLWGSCSGKGNLNFNCLLSQVPPQVADYVVVHELCHRKEMNHSARFWAEVERVLPDYREARKWLKEQGIGLIARLPQKSASA